MTSEILKQPREAAGAPKWDFAFPDEVVDDPSFSCAEKREILCEWASDRCAVESFPTLRWLPGTTFPVTFSAVMDALGQLDRIADYRAALESRPGCKTPVIALAPRKKSEQLAV